MTPNNIAFIILALLEASICASAAWVMVNGKEGWGWLIFIAIFILFCVKITDKVAV